MAGHKGQVNQKSTTFFYFRFGARNIRLKSRTSQFWPLEPNSLKQAQRTWRKSNWCFLTKELQQKVGVTKANKRWWLIKNCYRRVTSRFLLYAWILLTPQITAILSLRKFGGPVWRETNAAQGMQEKTNWKRKY